MYFSLTPMRVTWAHDFFDRASSISRVSARHKRPSLTPRIWTNRATAIALAKITAMASNSNVNKGTARSRPRHGDLRCLLEAATSQARRTRMDKGLVLEKVQALPSSRLAVMNRMIRRPTDRARRIPCSTRYIEADFALLRSETNVHHFPRRLRTQRCRKQSRRFQAASPSSSPGPQRRGVSAQSGGGPSCAAG